MQIVVTEEIRAAIRAAVSESALSTRVWGQRLGLPPCVVSRWLNVSGTAIRQRNWAKLYPAIAGYLSSESQTPITPLTPDVIEAKMDELLCEIVHKLNSKQKAAALDALRDICAQSSK